MKFLLAQLKQQDVSEYRVPSDADPFSISWLKISCDRRLIMYNMRSEQERVDSVPEARSVNLIS